MENLENKSEEEISKGVTSLASGVLGAGLGYLIAEHTGFYELVTEPFNEFFTNPFNHYIKEAILPYSLGLASYLAEQEYGLLKDSAKRLIK